MKFLFRPATILLNRLTFSKKFLLLFVIIFLTISVLASNIVIKVNDDLSFTKKEVEGIEILKEIYPLIQLTQQHRGLTVNVLSGDHSAKSTLTKVREEINGKLESLKSTLDNQEDMKRVNENFKQILSTWENTQNKTLSMEIPESIAHHNELIGIMFQVLVDLADESNLSLDSNLVHIHSGNLLIQTLPQITEFMGKSRAVGVGVATTGEMTENQRIELVYLMKLMDEYIQTAERSYQTIFTLDPMSKSTIGQKVEKSLTDTKQIVTIIDQELLNAETITITPAEYFELTTNTINFMYELISYQSDELKESLNSTINSLETEFTITIVVVILVLLFLLYLVIGFYLGIQDSVAKIRTTTELISKGDLSSEIKVDTKDEFGMIGATLTQMNLSLRNVIENTQQISSEVAASSQELLAITEETTQATNQITSSIEEVSTIAEHQNIQSKQNVHLVNELNQQLASVSQITSNASKASNESSIEAEVGNKNVMETIKQMKVIQEAVVQSAEVITKLVQRSTEIDSILDAITGIAEQTNLLSLNAAIEAARAGEHGKGFAVVAGEVRKLADESSVSAKKIRSLIGEIQQDTKQSISSMNIVSTETSEGMKLVEITGETFSEIVKATQKVAKEIEEVAQSAEKMISQVTQLEEAIDESSKQTEITESSTQMVAASTEEQLASMEEITSSANELSSRAQHLQNIVEQFKL
ncbi:methyl-accepting chemotaxis protein [Litchfieldia salsa]|uniref:Methyl-accepting chemotaxis protein n=1 Tax=Litchfieldia salsa TaxID=930152 RepID=A0A1H0TA41_9BACI|nr:methyl-accepting chemotaxis protein [Litchfieldia salsa]SDP50671.1 methyl-accepting chemotaxis protein [Litchfieldia salsa]